MTTQNEGTKQARRFSKRLFIEIGLFVFSLLIFFFLVKEFVLGEKVYLDEWGFNLVSHLYSPGMDSFMRAITKLGTWYFLMPAYILLTLYLLIFRKRKAVSMDIFSIGITSTIVMFGLKAFFQRQRPDDPLFGEVPGFSFPSGHSFSSFTFFGLLVYLVADWKNFPIALKWLLGGFFILLASTIAISRVYLRVHYPSDVIAGFFLCFIWLGVSFFVLHRVRGKRFMEN